jgi:hypothetical protein
MPIPQQVLDAGPEAVRTYKAALPYGEKWASMCALQCPPGTKGTDRAFNQGRYNQQQFDDMPKLMAEHMLREARKRNLTVEGIVSHKGIPVPPKRAPLSEKIIAEDMRRYRKLHPNKKAGELREMIIAKHSYRPKGK